MTSDVSPTTPDRVRAAARDAADAARTAWAQDAFPGISDLVEDQHNAGGRGTEPIWVGVWCGLPIEITYWVSHGRYRGHLMRRCETCTKLSSSGLASLTSAAELHHRHPDDAQLTGTVEVCYACRWLLDAQQVASTATSRWARWRFKISYGVSVDDVLARTP